MIKERFDVLKMMLVCFTIVLWLYWLWTRRDFYRFALKFPCNWGMPILGILPIIGHPDRMIPAITKLLENSKMYSILIWMGLHPTVLTADSDFVEKILSSSEMFNKPSMMYEVMYHAFGGGIIASPSEEWLHNRKMINPSFNHKVLLSFLPTFNKAKNATIIKFNALVGKGEQKLAAMLQKVSLTTSLKTTMGHVIEDDESEILDQYAKLMQVLTSTVFVKIMLNCVCLAKLFNFYPKYQRARDALARDVYNVVVEKLEKMKKVTTSHNKSKQLRPNLYEDMPQQTAEDKDETRTIEIKKTPNIFIDQAIEVYQRKQFTLNDIAAESNTIIGAAIETTASAIHSTLVMLAMHTQVQECLYEEVLGVFPDKEFEMEYEHMKQFPYLDRVINEVLRLVPPIPLIGRQTVKDFQLSNDILLPKNVNILISIFDLHRRKDIWGPNAHKFNPDHFLSENLSKKQANAYMPFSRGMRNCIGWRYAQFSIKVMLTGLVRNFRFTTTFKYDDLKFVNNLTLRYVDEPKLEIHRRL